MRHPSHRNPLTALLVLLVFLGTLATGGVPAVAEDATPVAEGVLPPDATIEGLGLGVWHARFWQWAWGLPVDPYADETGASCDFGQHGAVFFLMVAPKDVERACAVPTGMAIFVPIFNVECSTVEDPPYFGADEAALRACAKAHIDVGLEQDLPLAGLTVDGQAVADLSAYRAPTPLIHLMLPPNPDTGALAGVAWSVGDGYAALVGPFPEGEHVIEVSSPTGRGNDVHITYRLTVSSGEPAATPEA
jgi:hypothetical protein